jgi:hypothetical protein
VWCDDPPEDRVISIVAGCLANHDRAHSQCIYVYMTTEIVFAYLHPLRPYPTPSHMYTRPLVILTTTPSLWLIPTRDWCIYVYMTAEIALTSLHPPHPYRTRSHMHTAPSPLPRSSRSHALRYFGFLSVWPGLQFPAVWPLGLVLLYVYPRNPVYGGGVFLYSHNKIHDTHTVQ